MRILSTIVVLAALCVSPVQAQTAIDLGADPARELAAQAAGTPRGQELPANDPRIKQAREWLKKAAAATGESEDVVAASAVKLSRYIFDVMKVRATPMETLEALGRYAPAGRPMSDTTNAYFQARRDAPNKTHAEAMATMAGKK
jgi:hypothetical protein